MAGHAERMLRACRCIDRVDHGGRRHGAPCSTVDRRPKSQRGAGANAAVSSVATHGVHHNVFTLSIMRERHPQS